MDEVTNTKSKKKQVDIEAAAAAALGIGSGIDSLFDTDYTGSEPGTSEPKPASIKINKTAISKSQKQKTETLSAKKNNLNSKNEISDDYILKSIRPGRKRKHTVSNDEIDILGGLIEENAKLERLVGYVFTDQLIFVKAMAIKYNVSESNIIRIALEQAITNFAVKANVKSEDIINMCKNILMNQ